MKRLTYHIKHYIPLVSILTAGIFGFILFPFDKEFQGALTIAAASGYVAWGVIHHKIHEDLHLSIFLEYFTLGILGVVVVLSLIFST